MYSKDDVEAVTNKINLNFKNGKETKYFSEIEVQSQTANLSEILTKKFSPIEIGFISIWSSLSFLILFISVVILAMKKCTVGSRVF